MIKNKVDIYEKSIVYDMLKDLGYMSNDIRFEKVCHDLMRDIAQNAHNVIDLNRVYGIYEVIKQIYDNCVSSYFNE